MKKYLFIFLIITLIIFTSIIKTTTRELETKIFNSEEKIKILTAKKEINFTTKSLFNITSKTV